MTTVSGPGRSAAFNDGVSTSSSTLVNLDIEEETKRKLLRRAPMYGRDQLAQQISTSDNFAATSNLAGSAPMRRKKDYPDDHRCSDQEYASGLCACTEDGSAESSSSSSSSSSPTGEAKSHSRPPRRNSSEANEQRDEMYDMRLLAARKKKLLADNNTISPSIVSKSEKVPPFKDDSIDYIRQPLDSPKRLPPQVHSYSMNARLQRTNAERHRKDDSSQSDSDRMIYSKADRAWASSPLPSALLSSSNDIARSAYSEHGEISTSKMKRTSPEIKRASPTSVPRKSIDTFYQNLLQEEQQRQEEIRRKKEAARERRRQELRNRQQSQWPTATSPKCDQEDERRGHDGKLESPPRVNDISEAISAPNQGQSPTSNRATDAVSPKRAREPNAEVSPLRIAPRPSPVKPAAEAYKARLLALRSSSNLSASSSKEAKSPSVVKFHKEQSQGRDPIEEGRVSIDASDDHVTFGSDYTGQAPLQSTPPRSANTSSNVSRSRDSLSQLAHPIWTSSEGEKSIRATLRQLTVALQEINELKADPDLRERLSAAVKQGIQMDSDPLVSQEAVVTLNRRREEEIAQDNREYIEQLDSVRDRIKVLSNQATLPQGGGSSTYLRRSWTRSFLSLLIQGSILVLMMVAAEMRAHQLFLTTYYDPFQPYGLFGLPSVTLDTILQPFVPDLFDSSFETPIVINGSIHHNAPSANLPPASTFTSRHSDLRHAWRKVVTLSGYDFDGYTYACHHCPT